MSTLASLTQHPQRLPLHNEVHARPPEPVEQHTAVSCIVMWADAAQREASRAVLHQLLHEMRLPVPAPDATHLRIDLGSCRLRWELHTEFVSWTWIRPLPTPLGDVTALPQASDAAPVQWLASLPGQCILAQHLWVLGGESQPARGVPPWLQEDKLVASRAAGELANVYTDFTVYPDGASRIFVCNKGLPPRRMGRLVQRLLEIETYRMAALLGLPAARDSMHALAGLEGELAQLAGAIRSAEPESEPQLLDRLTRLAGQVESQYAACHSRLSASAAYFALVEQRVADVHEQRLEGNQTIGDFMERRLSPARNTCASALLRLEALSQRVSRMSNLLQTRVDINQKQGRQALLAAMNERQGLQLKLQSTVEGLSVAAITYYIVGLVSYVAKAAQKWGWPLSPETTAALAIPLVAFGVWWSIRKTHQKLLGGSHMH
ncbi:MAG: DUF3422 family protein [Comamonas sp.]